METRRLGTLPVGSRFVFGTFKGVPIEWVVIDQNHEGCPKNSTQVMASHILALMMFDGKEPDNPVTFRRTQGNNNVMRANLKQWAISSTEGPNWFYPQTTYDTPPSAQYAQSSGVGTYDAWDGFLTEFKVEPIYSMKETTRKIPLGSTDEADASNAGETPLVFNTYCSVFFLTLAELGLTSDDSYGVPYAYFDSPEKRIRKPTAQCVALTDYTSSTFDTDKGWNYWTGEPQVTNAYGVKR